MPGPPRGTLTAAASRPGSDKHGEASKRQQTTIHDRTWDPLRECEFRLLHEALSGTRDRRLLGFELRNQRQSEWESRDAGVMETHADFGTEIHDLCREGGDLRREPRCGGLQLRPIRRGAIYLRAHALSAGSKPSIAVTRGSAWGQTPRARQEYRGKDVLLRGLHKLECRVGIGDETVFQAGTQKRLGLLERVIHDPEEVRGKLVVDVCEDAGNQTHRPRYEVPNVRRADHG